MSATRPLRPLAMAHHPTGKFGAQGRRKDRIPPNRFYGPGRLERQFLGAADVFSQGPLSRVYRPFIGPPLKVGKGSKAGFSTRDNRGLSASLKTPRFSA